MSKNTLRFYFCVALISLAVGCQNNAEQSENIEAEPKPKPISIPVECKQPVQVQDIWKLEPILVRKGEITVEMNKDEKEKIIQAYIARKNKQYKICLKGSK